MNINTKHKKDIIGLMRQNREIGFIPVNAILRQNKKRRFFCIIKQNRIIAYILSGAIKDNKTCIFQMVVNREYRRKYIGTKLLRYFERKMLQRNVDRIACRVRSDFIISNNFWKKNGYYLNKQVINKNEKWINIRIKKLERR